MITYNYPSFLMSLNRYYNPPYPYYFKLLRNTLNIDCYNYMTDYSYTIYDDNTIGSSDKKYKLNFVIITNIVSFVIGFGVHYLWII